MASIKTQTLTISNGETTSTAFGGEGMAAYGLQMPAAFTGASISFLTSADGSTFQALYEYDSATDDGSATRVVSLAVVQARCYVLPAALTAWRFWKIVSVGAEGAARSLIVIGKAP